MDGELAKAMADAYTAGGTQRQVAVRFGTYPAKVREALALEGVTARGVGEVFVDPAEVMVWRARYEAGETVRAIAQDVGRGWSPVARRIETAGGDVHARRADRHIRWTDAALAEVESRHAAGEQYVKIAASLGVSAQRLELVRREARRRTTG